MQSPDSIPTSSPDPNPTLTLSLPFSEKSPTVDKGRLVDESLESVTRFRVRIRVRVRGRVRGRVRVCVCVVNSYQIYREAQT